MFTTAAQLVKAPNVQKTVTMVCQIAPRVVGENPDELCQER